jgi:hypothetical protein
VDPRSELVLLLEERILPPRERRRRRLRRIPGPVRVLALEKCWWHRHDSGPLVLTREEYVALSFGALPEELEELLQLQESQGRSRAEIGLTPVRIIDGKASAGR